MRQMISVAFAALAAVAAGAAPASACGFNPCSPCGSPCAQTYGYAPNYGYSTCGTGCGAAWSYERLAEPTTQYYYVNQGPTYSGPGAFAPYPTYQEGSITGWDGRTHPYYYHPYRRHYYG